VELGTRLEGNGVFDSLLPELVLTASSRARDLVVEVAWRVFRPEGLSEFRVGWYFELLDAMNLRRILGDVEEELHQMLYVF